MRINHNITALNTYNKLSANQATTAKSLEKLSSGLKINRAGDNAAGLAISEKMRGQIRGLDTATSNASDGISLIKVAEGGLNETHSILQRMRELAVQSANDTNTDDDRAEMQKEVDQLKTEITRISTDTEFNTKKLLNGDYGTKAIASAPADVSVKSALASTISSGTIAYTASTAATARTGEGSVDLTADRSFAADTSLIINGTTIGFSAGTYTQAQLLTRINQFSSETGYTASINATHLLLTADDVGTASTLTIGGESEALTEVTGTVTQTAGTDAQITFTGIAGTDYTRSGSEITFTGGAYKGLQLNVEQTTATAGTIAIQNNELDFQIGANEDQTMSITLQNMSAGSLGVNDIDLSSAALATAAITTIDAAISSVSSERAKLGAYQNRLEHTINNLGTSSENTSSAESRIRDVDMAKEMMEFTKNNILSQAAQSMLAQANQQPQGVLQLLQ